MGVRDISAGLDRLHLFIAMDSLATPRGRSARTEHSLATTPFLRDVRSLRIAPE
jgi:hypothetical protein